MNQIQKETREFLETMPEIDSATAYGSAYFKQAGDDYGEKKSLDLILSVDRVNDWHNDNYKMNPQYYASANTKNLLNNKLKGRKVKFPKSLGCFFTEYNGKEYKCVVVDKRLLNNDLLTWANFSLAGRFQKETVQLVDNTDGHLLKLMKYNYNSATKTAQLLLSEYSKVSMEKYYQTIASLSFMGDIRVLFHAENKNKIPNLVTGSWDFFERTYGALGSIEREEDEVYINPDLSLDELPYALANYIYHNVPEEERHNRQLISQVVKNYFRMIDFKSSTKMALRCNQTVGHQKSFQTFSGKLKKGFQSKSSR